MDALVGYSGFVGQNLSRQHHFEGQFNSANIADIQGQKFDTLVCCAVPATMWLANNDPSADRANIHALFEMLQAVQATRVVLVSTIAVYRDVSKPVDETNSEFQVDLAYGRHRHEFEELIAGHFSTVLILRLPALFGHGLKKNFLFDLLNPVPSYVTPELFGTILESVSGRRKDLIEAAFVKDTTTGMWRFERAKYGHGAAGAEIFAVVQAANVSAVEFTHADSTFQFYGLQRLWRDILRARNAGIKVLNLATKPIRAGDIHQACKGHEMAARVAKKVDQDMRSCHAEIWGRSDGYLYGGDETLNALSTFFESQKG